MSDSDLLIARTTAVIVHGGRTYRIRRGETVVRADDPVVAGREKLFRPLPVTRLGHRAARSSETATADPGELREVTAPPTGPAPEPAEPVEPTTREIREWAREHGYEVTPRGKLPVEVVEAYRLAHEGE